MFAESIGLFFSIGRISFKFWAGFCSVKYEFESSGSTLLIVFFLGKLGNMCKMFCGLAALSLLS